MPKPPRRFWTSDPHIGHERVATVFRPFESVKDHDDTLARRWDAVVRDQDIVYVTGDIAINPRRDGAFKWFADRPGIKHLILGNHDPLHPLHGSRALRERRRAMDEFAYNATAGIEGGLIFPSWFDVFATIDSIGMTTINGQKVMMSHFPYSGEGSREIEDRYSEFRLRNEGHALLHGHIHSKRQVTSVVNRMIHIGVDAWDWTPVSEAQISYWLQRVNRFHEIREAKNAESTDQS